MEEEKGQICEFFTGQRVLLTGGTGLLGKIVVEKLLRVCNLDKLYLLMRAKGGKTNDQRFEEYFDWRCFDKLKETRDNFRSKVKLVNGDCQQPLLGLDNDQREMLKDEITCVIHIAAVVKFDQFIRYAAYINVRATMDLITMAREMPNLVSFIHVSTAFSNYPRGYIGERFYDPPLKGEDLLSLVDMLDDDTLRNITPQLLGKYANTYVYTKNIAEDVIKRKGEGLPVAVVRPGIVTCVDKDPLPGWIENIYSMTGVLGCMAIGLLRNVAADPTAPLWYVPVDHTANIILGAAWKVATQRKSQSQMSVYNHVGSRTNVPSMNLFITSLSPRGRLFAFSQAVWCPPMYPIVHSKYWYKICSFFQQMVPAYLADVVFGVLGKPRMAVKSMSKLLHLMNLLSKFTFRHFDFNIDNVEALRDQIREVDKKQFDFEFEVISTDDYFNKIVLGSRCFIMNDPMSTMAYSQKKMTILIVLHYTVCVVYYYLIFKLLLFLWCLLF